MAGGTVYGSYDTTKGIFTDEQLECKDILTEIGVTGGPVIQERTAFKAITVYNTIRGSEDLERIREDLKNENHYDSKTNDYTKKLDDDR